MLGEYISVYKNNQVYFSAALTKKLGIDGKSAKLSIEEIGGEFVIKVLSVEKW